MSSLPLARGGTVLIPTGPTDHLHFICCDPVFDARAGSEAVLMVNISSAHPSLQFDSTCVLSRGDHPYLVRDSFVYYRKAGIFRQDNVERSIIDGTFSTHAACAENVLQRILDGFGVSNEVRPVIRRFCEKHCL